MAVRLLFGKTASSPSALTGRSKWWGSPDLPPGLVPGLAGGSAGAAAAGLGAGGALTFVCQIRCEELAPFDPKNLLPHQGLLYFFAALGPFLRTPKSPDITPTGTPTDTPTDTPTGTPKLGEWTPDAFRVLYSPTCDNLRTCDAASSGLPAEKLTFASGASMDDSFRLLGYPYYEEVRDECPGMISLLQVDESDDWGLHFYDCGMLNFLIYPTDLATRRWGDVRCYLHSA